MEAKNQRLKFLLSPKTDPDLMFQLSEIDAIERPYCEAGRPTLGKAYAMLRQRWQAGGQDRETALRLMFLCWYALSEPGGLTGIQETRKLEDYREEYFEIFDRFGGDESFDPELLFVSGYMFAVNPLYLDDDDWQPRVERWLDKAKLLNPEGFSEAEFEGRGAYGHYFAHVLHCKWQYKGPS